MDLMVIGMGREQKIGNVKPGYNYSSNNFKSLDE